MEEEQWAQSKAYFMDQAKLPPKLFQLRQKLGEKAKQEPKFRFYTLYGTCLKFFPLASRWIWRRLPVP